MTKSKFLFAALVMSAPALFFGSCDPKENESNTKLVSKITFAAEEDVVLTFDYDAQNRVSKIDGSFFENVTVTYFADSVAMNGTLIITNIEESYNGSEPVRTKEEVPFQSVAVLNSNGYAASIKGSTEYGNMGIRATYYDDYLEKCEINGIETRYSYTWTNGNISQIKITPPPVYDSGGTFTFQYSNYLSKNNIDIMPFFIDYGDSGAEILVVLCQMLGLMGKQCANLPVNVMREDAYNTDLTYVFDNDGYPLTVSSSGKGTMCTIEYK
ncbi:MAG: hypothetical protein LBB53_05030 [Prevotellaceae bacterium]|jgi:hypothetical protein|nr:hypothetical protein [Prevotellaceae bacterium]